MFEIIQNQWKVIRIIVLLFRSLDKYTLDIEGAGFEVLQVEGVEDFQDFCQ